ncbi:MAG: hypothetical protein JSW07_04185, partial [bacterium]
MEEEQVYIALDESAELPARLHELENQLHQSFNANKYNIVIDLEKIKLSPTTFIVTLIEATSQARRMGGDIKLINLNSSIRNNLVTFSPRTYLSIEPSEKYALYDFDETFVLHTEFDISDTIIKKRLIAKDSINEKSKSKEKEQLSGAGSISELIELARDGIRVNSKVDNLYEICDFVLVKAEKAGFNLRERGKIKVTVYEACLNVVEHAYFSNPENWIHVY